MFYLIEKMMNDSDKVLRWVQVCNDSNDATISFNKNTTALTLLLTMMFHWIDKRMNDSDDLPLQYNVANSNEGMTHELSFPQ